MSLVDYDSSDDEDTQIGENNHDNEEPSNGAIQPPPRRPSPVSGIESSKDKKPTTASLIKDPPTIEKLPDASLLLNSPILSYSASGGFADHSSRVAAAVAANASRKREANGTGSSSIRGKVPRGSKPHSKNIPDTSAGQLVPPQLRGRSNVVTEDIGRLFVKKQGQAAESKGEVL
ncbi:hypothetical protein V2J09_003379 [Rumex salicifolius]